MLAALSVPKGGRRLVDLSCGLPTLSRSNLTTLGAALQVGLSQWLPILQGDHCGRKSAGSGVAGWLQ